jgi:hypothetical protein
MESIPILQQNPDLFSLGLLKMDDGYGKIVDI